MRDRSTVILVCLCFGGGFGTHVAMQKADAVGQFTHDDAVGFRRRAVAAEQLGKRGKEVVAHWAEAAEHCETVLRRCIESSGEGRALAWRERGRR